MFWSFLVILAAELPMIIPLKNDMDLLDPREKRKKSISSSEYNSLSRGLYEKTSVGFLANQNNL